MTRVAASESYAAGAFKDESEIPTRLGLDDSVDVVGAHQQILLAVDLDLVATEEAVFCSASSGLTRTRSASGFKDDMLVSSFLGRAVIPRELTLFVCVRVEWYPRMAGYTTQSQKILFFGT